MVMEQLDSLWIAIISTKSWSTRHIRQQHCFCVQKHMQRTAISGCKEGKSGEQVPQPTDKGISQEVMIQGS